jgi:hypothetical protein
MPKVIDSESKVAYIYSSATDKWHPIAGAVNTGAAYTWSADQRFSSTVTFDTVVKAKAGVNNFLNPAARDLVFTDISAENKKGIVCFVRNDAAGLPINQIQYFDGTSWRSSSDSTPLLSKTNTATYTITLEDAGRTIIANSDTANEILVPANSTTPFVIGQRLDILRYGVGITSIAGAVGVTIQSKNSNKKIAARYSGATLIKIEENTWILVGDLIA